MAAPLRIFLAHQKGIEPEELSAAHDGMRTALTAMNLEVESITNSGDYWAAHFAASGSWDSWCAKWATGMDMSGRYTFDLIVSLDKEGIRKGNGKGIQMALKANRPVFWFGAMDLAAPAPDGMVASQFYGVTGIYQSGGNEAWPVYTLIFS